MILRNDNIIKCKPFLKWAGGKQQIIKYMLKSVPNDFFCRTYYEPFLGGGSLFFALQPQKAILSDLNEHLILAYKYIRVYPELIADYLKVHKQNNSQNYYYRIRKTYNQTTKYSASQAARLIYLNKSCFNGIFRVNQKGKFNVPYGQRENPPLPTRSELKQISKILRNTQLSNESFEKVLVTIPQNAFVYLDPPYPPLNGTSFFTHYTVDRFNENDQKKLARIVYALHFRGCKFMLSNADTKLIRKLYNKFKITKIPVIRYITCKKIRHKVSEVIITNYEVMR